MHLQLSYFEKQIQGRARLKKDRLCCQKLPSHVVSPPDKKRLIFCVITTNQRYESHRISVSYNQVVYCRSSTVQGEAVLERLQIYLANPKNYESVRLRPGELLLLNNRRVVHARTPFKALFDGADRWLLRVWLRSELMYGACDAMTTRNVFI